MSNWKEQYEDYEQSRANAHLCETEPETAEPEWDGEYDEDEPF